MNNSYSVELKLNIRKYSDRRFLENYFDEVAKISNTIRRFAIKQIGLLERDRCYKALLSEYLTLPKGKKKSIVSKQLHTIVESYGLTKYEMQKWALDLRRNLKHVHSDVYQKISDSVWRSVSDYLYGKGKLIHFKKWNDFLSFEGKKNTTGIIYHKGKVYINCSPNRPKGGIILDVIMPNNKNSKHWMYETTCLCDRTKYCRIVRKQYPTGWRYYVQLVNEGIPPQRHAIGVGVIGIDIGVSTIATVSDTKCHLDVIGGNLDTKDKEIRRLQRKLDRSRRASNPDNYKADGTIRKGRKVWKYSNRYKKMCNELRTLKRKRAAMLRQWQSQYASNLLEEGNQVYSEKMNYQGLARRKKQTERNNRGRIKKKKRFGKSVSTRAPAQLMSIIKRKLSYVGGTYNEVNTITYKASQYNHVTDTYVKKKLSKRYNTINGKWVQRDLYSAFLIRNPDKTLEHADRDACIDDYNSFKIKHDLCMEEIINSDIHIPRSYGICTSK